MAVLLLEGDPLSPQVHQAVGADVADGLDPSLRREPGRRAVVGLEQEPRPGAPDLGRARPTVGRVAMLDVVEGDERGVLHPEVIQVAEALDAEEALVHTSLNRSTTPLRHGSRKGMNRGTTPKSRHVATTGPKEADAGGMPPRKLEWLSNWAARGIPTRDHIPINPVASRFGRGDWRISLAASWEPTSSRFRAWNSTPP